MDRYLGIIKAFVVISGIVLIAGTGLLIWLLATRGASQIADQASGTLQLPAGTSVDQMIQDGDALLLLLSDESGRQFIGEVQPKSAQVRIKWQLEAGGSDGN